MWREKSGRYPQGMGDTYAISGLGRKRTYLAGDIEVAERAFAKLGDQLAAIDATLRLFRSNAEPSRDGRNFDRREAIARGVRHVVLSGVSRRARVDGSEPSGPIDRRGTIAATVY